MDDILRKVQKTLALASDEGATPEESQNALLMAQRLAIKHGINLNELGALPPSDSREIRHVEVKESGLSSWWREKLLSTIGNNFKCEHYRNWTDKRGGKDYYRLMMVGFVDEVEIAAAVFKHAERSIMYHAREYIRKMGRRIKSENKNKFKNEFIKGYLDGLAQKFKKQVEGEGWGLVIVKDALILETTAHMTKYTLQLPNEVSDGANAYQKGFDRGHGYVYPAGMLGK